MDLSLITFSASKDGSPPPPGTNAPERAIGALENFSWPSWQAVPPSTLFVVVCDWFALAGDDDDDDTTGDLLLFLGMANLLTPFDELAPSVLVLRFGRNLGVIPLAKSSTFFSSSSSEAKFLTNSINCFTHSALILLVAGSIAIVAIADRFE